MFPYFGRKSVLAPHYPAPAYGIVIEPFAGSMAYTLHHRPASAIGIEADQRVVALWNRMIAVTPEFAEVVEPPLVGGPTDDLLVKLCSYSEHALLSGTMTVTSRMVRDWRSVHRRAALDGPWAASAVDYRHGSYEDAPDIEATWFIDPPYQYANRRGYLHGASDIDFAHLREWVLARRGQVIVCEQAGADWLPFHDFRPVASHRGRQSSEVIYVLDNAVVEGVR